MERKTVVISGGSSGLGLYLVEMFLARGYNVATFSRTLSDDLKEMIDKNRNLFWNSLDVNDFVALKKYVLAVKKIFGSIDILINNIGYLYEGVFVLTPNREMEKTVSTNIMAPLILTREVLKSMVINKRGIIVNISSINSCRGHKGVSVYSLSKAAIDGWTRSLAKELGGLNIRINSVVPGFFDSSLVSYLTEERKKQILKRTALDRLGTVKDVGDTVLFLCSESASFITGQSITVDGGILC
ncbi:SDR family NAD(P)-dependent oxidoreductase [Lonsdalea quercina]|uniref:SDR family NAD(P)-dependent oxidoreductase n=1 Tax=Lonsdalea quercina TaxID=71657 RepID=UPI003975A279